MTDEGTDGLARRIGAAYHPPPATPREEMWSKVEARLEARASGATDLGAERRRRQASASRSLGWGIAAAALLVLGIGIGRMTAPAPPGDVPLAESAAGSDALGFAAAEHLERTELLLRMVRNDARQGGLDPFTRDWARGTLAETRLLLGAIGQSDRPALGDLLEDLELVLVQIVGASQEGEARASDDLALALRGLEEREVLSRIRAGTPWTLSGT